MNEPMREVILKAEVKNMDFLSREETIAVGGIVTAFKGTVMDWQSR